MNRAGPISPRKSALAIRVARHLSLDADEEAALDMLEGVPQKLTPGEPLLTAGDPTLLPSRLERTRMAAARYAEAARRLA